MANRQLNILIDEKLFKHMERKAQKKNLNKADFVRYAIQQAVDEPQGQSAQIAALETELGVYKKLYSDALKKSIAAEVMADLEQKLGPNFWEKIK